MSSPHYSLQLSNSFKVALFLSQPILLPPQPFQLLGIELAFQLVVQSYHSVGLLLQVA
jgi:hypothetical protein